MSTPSKFNPFGFSRPLYYLFLVSIVVFLFLWSVRIVQSYKEYTAPPRQMVKHSASISALWERGGFHISSSDSSIAQMAALNYKLALVNNYSDVVALDGQTGKEIWTYAGNDVIFELAISPTTVFVGSYEVVALDVETGKVLWTADVPYAKGISTLFVQGDILYVEVAASMYELLNAKTGEVLEWGDLREGKFPSSEIYPAREIRAANLEGTLVLGNTAYWGGTAGVHARDISSGNDLWFSDVSIISEVASTWDSIYAISENGELVRFDPATGTAYVEAYYTPVPLTSFGEGDGEAHNFVAADSVTHMVYVYLGDGETLLAYHLNP